MTHPIVLVHAGIADNGMWDPFAALLPRTSEVRRHELYGFGQTPMPATVFSQATGLAQAISARSILIGASFGGLVALEVAATHPELVAGLVLIDAPLPDHEFADQMEAYWAEEERLVEAGQLDAAAELNVEFWIAGAPRDTRELVKAMTKRSFELQLEPHGDELDTAPFALGDVRAPTLVIVGEHDQPDFKEIASRLASELHDAGLVVIDGAAHLPSLEQPEATAAAVCEFLAGLPA